MEHLMGITPDGREVRYDDKEAVFITQPPGDNYWISAPSLREVLAAAGWEYGSMKWNA